MYNPGHGIRLRSNARTNTGRVRENNEDRVLLWARDHFVLAIVADGMGGAAAGEEASRIAVETIHNELVEYNIQADDPANPISADKLSELLRMAIQSANEKIVQHATQYPELKGMGTTVTLAIVRNNYAIIGHVGDSRAYFIDGFDSSISQITSDHSFVEAMVAAGHITRSEAEDHPMKNVLYRALGQSEAIDVDIYHSYLRAGDRLVLCSDGLTLHVKPQEIAKLSLADKRPDITSEKLISLANDRGGRDNVSVVVINVEQEQNPQRTTDEINYHHSDEDDTLVMNNKYSAYSSDNNIASNAEGTPKIETFESDSHQFIKPERPLPYNSPLSIKNLVHQRHFSRDYEDNLGEGFDTAYPQQ